MTEKSDSRKTTGVLKLSVLLAGFLALVKFAAGILTNSMAILASALDSFLDVGGSLINLFAANEAAKPPDKEHAYGHGKIESLAGLFQSLVIGVSGFYLVIESGKRFFFERQVQQIEVGVGVMALSLLISLILVFRLSRANRHQKSIILTAESLHYRVDIFSNLAVIAALILVRITGMIVWDLMLSIAISVYVLKEAAGLLKKSVDELIDRSLPEDKVKKIKQFVLNFNDSIIGMHNFRSRSVGNRMFLDFHIEIRGVNDFKVAHDMTEALIEEVRTKWPDADLTVHYDPEGED